MKKLSFSVALAALAAVLTTPVVAADADVPAAPGWTGFHIGVGGGGNFAFVDSFTNFEHEENVNNNGSLESGDIFSDLGKADFFGTVEIGADYQMDRMVAGVLANYDFGKTKMKHQGPAIEEDNNGNVTDIGETDLSWEVGDSWAVGGRLGFLATDSTLIYALGGYVQADIKNNVDMDSNNHGAEFTNDGWEDGYFVGAGIETMLTDSLSLKGEYRFADFGKVNRDDFENIANNNGSNDLDSRGDVTVHSVRAVLSFRF